MKHFSVDLDVSPVVLDVDVVRDGWDWFVLWVGVAGAIASTAVGIIAIVLASKANRHAKAAMQATADAEVRAIERATAERLRVFHLEVLRDLGEMLDEKPEPFRMIANHSPIYVDQLFGTRLAMLPPDDLPFWRAYGELSMEKRWDLFADLSAVEVEGARKSAATMKIPWLPPGGFVERLKQELRQEVLHAVERRMQARD